MTELITVYLIGVLFAYMRHCGFTSSICYAYNFELDKEEKKEEYLELFICMWYSWIWFIIFTVDYFKNKDKYFFKLKL